MKNKTIVLGVLLACLFAVCAQALTIENLIGLLRPDYFRLDGWLAYNTMVISTITTTTTTTMPSFTVGNETLQFNVSWCINITQINVADYAFLYQGRKIDLNATDVETIRQAD